MGSHFLEPRRRLLPPSSCFLASCFSQSVLGTSELEDFILLVPKRLGSGGPGQRHGTEDCSLLHLRGAQARR